MKRQHKSYLRPRKAYEKTRMESENVLVEKYGLKNKREIWKAIAKIRYFRNRVKSLINATPEEQEGLLTKMKALGLKVSNIPEALGLDKEDLLKRRLATIVFEKGFAKTPKQARQMIVHKKVLVDGKVVDSPSYIVSINEENKINVKVKAKKVTEKKEEVKVEVSA